MVGNHETKKNIMIGKHENMQEKKNKKIKNK